MRAQRLYAIAVILALLVPAAWGAVPRRMPFTRYWPFIDYPMYSQSHFSGESAYAWQLRVAGCQPGGDPRIVSEAELHLPHRTMLKLLRQAANGPPHGKSRSLVTDMARQLPDPVCGIEIWAQRYVLGPGGIVDRNPPWQLHTGWALGQATAAR
ncbi:MAG TPA: hypothetical protein VFL95_03560 [Gemmatimonadales bacterium]|nr:hypothetical protein [Gemmatimonadales bacterium]